ncbi:hypothetical protein F4604DRAFT_1681900 [Suillus subluteus]|nr:hypothetical protein F4604DRAFT_1681900 [Suillus subluteus]
MSATKSQLLQSLSCIEGVISCKVSEFVSSIPVQNSSMAGKKADEGVWWNEFEYGVEWEVEVEIIVGIFKHKWLPLALRCAMVILVWRAERVLAAVVNSVVSILKQAFEQEKEHKPFE